jgi:hypothetical protein
MDGALGVQSRREVVLGATMCQNRRNYGTSITRVSLPFPLDFGSSVGAGTLTLRNNQLELDSKGMKHRKNLPDMAGRFSLFEINDKPQTGPRSQRQIPLGNSEIPPNSADFFSDLFGCVFHS